MQARGWRARNGAAYDFGSDGFWDLVDLIEQTTATRPPVTRAHLYRYPDDPVIRTVGDRVFRGTFDNNQRSTLLSTVLRKVILP